MTRTAEAAEAAEAAAQVDTLVDGLESRVWADVQAVQAARKRVQAALSAAPTLHRLLAGLPTIEGVIRSTYDRIANGEAVDPDAFAAALTAAAPTLDAARHAAIATSGGNDGSRNELVAAEHAHQGAALAVLDRTVKKLVIMARPLFEAAAALDGTRRYAEIGETQGALERAAVAHTRIRTVQLAITYDPMDYDIGRLLRTFGIVRDVRPALPAVVGMAAGVGAGYQPEVPEISDGEALLRFICRPDLEPWCPTYPEARKAKAAFDLHIGSLRDQAENPMRPARDDSGDPQVAVRGAAGQTPKIHTPW